MCVARVSSPATGADTPLSMASIVKAGFVKVEKGSRSTISISPSQSSVKTSNEKGRACNKLDFML